MLEGANEMKTIATKLDNGYTLTIVHPAVPESAAVIAVPEWKQRLVFENKEALIAKLVEVL
jgi:hypothetical protein